MNKVCIGIPIYAEPDRLLATLASVRANTGGQLQLLLLPDGPDHATVAALADHREIPQLATVEARGGATCFNRLAQFNDADVVLLLEDGALVGPGWLDYLLSALQADPHNGLVGPSTNRSWNEQGVFSPSDPAPGDVTRAAAEAGRRRGTAVRTLEPLYSLGDFCYGVRREVIEAIGLADEGYGLGPCWEMDYNIRAARAGWRGVWACAAYVHRAPFTIRRRRDEARLFESSKRRYQDKFCGARLRGEKSDYRVHCRGDSCPNFAPPSLIRITNPAPSLLPLPPTPTERPKPSPVRVVAEEPLASCIMPTCNRPHFVPEAVRCFLIQDYPNLELVIVDDGTEQVAPLLPSDPRLRLIRLPEKRNVGSKRNIACASARGEFIIHWDDDDWYPADRIRRQLGALRAVRAEICGTSTLYYHDAAAVRAWRYQYSSGGRPWVAGNTLAYRKSWWAGHPFPEIQVGEDSRFVWAAPAGAVCDLAAPELCVARIHGGNTCRKQTIGSYWQECSVGELLSLLGLEWPRFLSVWPSGARAETTPLVSCIMPTFNRRAFLPLALESYSWQDYPAKELIVVDDGTDIVRDVVDGVPDVRYLRLDSRASIGEKRNRACAAAEGAIIAHWDDDDWYAPNRLRHQIAPLLSGQADLTGLENSCLLDLSTGCFWRTRADLHRRMFMGDVHGGTLVYWKRLVLEGLSYPPLSLAEDAAFILAALRTRKRLLRLSNDGVFVYVRHGSNAWRFQPGQFLDPDGWAVAEPPSAFSNERLTVYREAAANSGRA
jgi:glycosyltransferase involved in cell wall biosynthesis